MTRILYIRNPAANGARSTGWEEFQSLWPDPIESEDIRVTERPGHAREIAASVEGYDILVAVGGDGTVSEVLSGIIEHEAPRPKLAIVPGGTGNHTAYSVGILCAEDAVAALRTQHMRTFDIFRTDSQVAGRPAHRYAFIASNVGFFAVSLGIRRNWMRRLLGLRGAVNLSKFVGAVIYRPPHMTVRWNGQEYCGRTWKVLVANVEWIRRGRMLLAPGACTDDGELNVSIVPFRSKARTLLEGVSVSCTRQQSALYFTARDLTVDSSPSVDVEVDGDLFGTTPVTFTVLPQAVQIISLNSANGENALPTYSKGCH